MCEIALDVPVASASASTRLGKERGGEGKQAQPIIH